MGSESITAYTPDQRFGKPLNPVGAPACGAHIERNSAVRLSQHVEVCAMTLGIERVHGGVPIACGGRPPLTSAIGALANP